ncbi:heterokaryon incompatibility [Zalerion maritima]|uniref:Heterokaryon incompatibility n=1 Tax=Zalerion maritima TaxID=339359 RepID=A0AAD5WMT5_9PEZI|nr:heterokaryon incompatibility [Zalerion maritima]
MVSTIEEHRGSAVTKPHSKIYPQVPLVYPDSSLRLLKIEPGWPGDSICVSLVSINERHKSPPYVALSYTWGDPTISEQIKCNSVDIDVTISLANALRVLRELPAEGDPAGNGVSVISRSHPLHSGNRVWSGIARNINEEELVRTRRAGKPSSERFFWIDALCINQEDKPESAAQVATMRDIYSRADKVRVFLGKEIGPQQKLFTPTELTEPVSRTIDKWLPKMTIQELGLEPLVLMFIVQALRNEGRVEVNGSGIKTIIEKGFPGKERKEWNALRAFLKLPWFYRVWIIQEIVLAKEATLAIGNWEIDWEPFAKAIDVLEATNLPISHHVKLSSTSKETWTGFDVAPAHYLGKLRHRPGKTKPLYYLLVDALERGSTDPRDHVYAVLGMASEMVDPEQSPIRKELLAVDYGKSVGEIFRDATRFIMFNLNTLHFLAVAQLTPKSKALACSSWVPNWAEPRTCFPLLAQFFNANLKQPGFSTSYNDVPNVLAVPGYKVGKIVKTTPVLEGDWNEWHYPPLQEEIQFFNASWELVSKRLETKKPGQKNDGLLQPEYYQSQGAASEALIYTLTANHDDESLNGRGDGDVNIAKSGRAWMKKYADAFSKKSGLKKIGHVLKGVVIAPEGVHFQSAFMRAAVGRRFFLTEQGIMGIGSASLEAEDELFVVYGLSVPMLLRPVKAQRGAGVSGEKPGPQSFVVVGECYAHGIMDGEVVRHERDMGREPESLSLV